MSWPKRYVLPAILATGLVTGAFILECLSSPVKPHKKSPQTLGRIVITMPHGRVLYVIVDQLGVYVGNDYSTVGHVADFLRREKIKWHPDYVIIRGTDLARYSDVVRVAGAVRSIFPVPRTLESKSVPIGTRCPAIAVCRYFWQYWAVGRR